LLVVHLSETPTTTIFKIESYILLYSLKKYRNIKIKDNKLDFICFLDDFIIGKGVVGVLVGGLSRLGVRRAMPCALTKSNEYVGVQNLSMISTPTPVWEPRKKSFAIMACNYISERLTTWFTHYHLNAAQSPPPSNLRNPKPPHLSSYEHNNH
jgi:hypothetical protein